MRAPNGYGAVYKMSGRRRKPWAVRVTTGYNDNGSPVVKYVGYYATKAEAFAARDAYNKADQPSSVPTFAEVAEAFKEEHYKEIGEKTRKVYNTACRKCSVIACKPVNEISYMELQELINACPESAQNSLRSFLKQTFDYAIRFEYINKNPAERLKVVKREKSTAHYRYTAEEIKKLWAVADNPAVAFVLLTIYTGMRPSELMNAELQDNCFIIKQGKTKNAVRIVPVHPDAQCLLQYVPFVFKDLGRNAFVDNYYKPALMRAGCYEYIYPATGQIQKHKPHDGRHTFTSRWRELRLDDGVRAYIQGHTQKDIGSRVYTHYDMEAVYAELCKLVY